MGEKIWGGVEYSAQETDECVSFALFVLRRLVNQTGFRDELILTVLTSSVLQEQIIYLIPTED